MTLRNVAILSFVIALIPAGAAAYYVHRDMAAVLREDTPAGHGFGVGTLGDTQFRVLTDITKAYVSSKAAGVTSAMRAGTELAPMAVLNEALEKQGLKWRVRDVHGLFATTFDVA